MITLEEIRENYDKGFITIRKHPFAELYILNYTPLASKQAVWNEVTLYSRGLIINKKGTVISYPFRKFFELEQLRKEVIPKTKPVKIYEKIDGALGILYWYNDVPYVSTRGSFTSYQAIRATEVLHQKYTQHFSDLNRNYTYLFEIVLPENRIVLDYGNTEDLFLIGVINNTNQEEVDITSIPKNPFPLPKEIPSGFTLQEIEDSLEENSEGYVLIYENNFRIKLKSESYRNLFRFYTHDLKKYAINKTLHNIIDESFENKLNPSDVSWLNELIQQIRILKKKLRECKDKCTDEPCGYDCIFHDYNGETVSNVNLIVANRIMSNQFYTNLSDFKKKFKPSEVK